VHFLIYWQGISVYWLGHELNNWDSFPGRDREGISSLYYHIKTFHGAHPPSCPVHTGSKMARTWSWPLMSIYWQG
jgi:hypothetical protein